MANPWTIGSTATRHMLDASVGFGLPSDRYNARDQYRRTYNADQRNGAGLGTALAVALPASTTLAWVQRGMRVPGVESALARNVARGAGLVALGAMTTVGVKKSIEIAQDDGNLGGAGTAVGMLGGAGAGIALGNRIGGKYAPLVMGGTAIAGAIAGHFGGKAIHIGEGHIGEAYEQAPQVDANAGERTKSFARGAFDHFTEVGPTTQGIAFGYRWGMQDAVKNKYSNAERSGAMHGDLLAAGILGGGALAMGAGLTGLSSHAGAGVSNLRAGADIAGRVLSRGPLMGAVQKMSSKGAIGAAAAGAGIAALSTWKGYEADSDTMGSGAATAIAAGTLAATAGTAALVSRSGAMRSMAAAPRAGTSMLVAAAMIGVLSSARLPAQQFINDAKTAQAVKGSVDTPVAATAAGVGAVGGGLGAFKGLSKLVPAGGIQLGRFHLPKGAIVGVGTAVGAGALGGVGMGLSSTMPDIKTVGMAVAGGAAAGAALGGFARGMRVAPAAIGGAALGLSASALLNDE